MKLFSQEALAIVNGLPNTDTFSIKSVCGVGFPTTLPRPTYPLKTPKSIASGNREEHHHRTTHQPRWRPFLLPLDDPLRPALNHRRTKTTAQSLQHTARRALSGVVRWRVASAKRGWPRRPYPRDGSYRTGCACGRRAPRCCPVVRSMRGPASQASPPPSTAVPGGGVGVGRRAGLGVGCCRRWGLGYLRSGACGEGFRRIPREIRLLARLRFFEIFDNFLHSCFQWAKCMVYYNGFS